MHTLYTGRQFVFQQNIKHFYEELRALEKHKTRNREKEFEENVFISYRT